jgi:hypothetical protein
MTVLMPDLTTRTVSGDSFSVDDEGNLVINSGDVPVAAFAVNHWAAVWVKDQVSMP